MSGSAADLILQQRYGYGPGRGPRRMPFRMGNRFVNGAPDQELFGVEIQDGSADPGDIGDAVVSELFGEDDEDLDDEDDDEDDDEEDEDEDEDYGSNEAITPPPPLPAPEFSPGPSSAVVTVSNDRHRSSLPTWRDHKHAQKDVWRATKKLARAQDLLVQAMSSAPMLPSFGRTRYGAVVSSPSALQSFVLSLAGMSAAQMHAKTVEFITSYVSKIQALSNRGRFNDQYARFRQAAQEERGFGARTQAEADGGIRLIEAISGLTVSSLDREAMRAMARAQAALVVRGLA